MPRHSTKDNGRGSTRTNAIGPLNHRDGCASTQSTRTASPTMPPRWKASGRGKLVGSPDRNSRVAHIRRWPSSSNLTPACIRKRPRKFVRQVRFSTSFTPWAISHAQGWRIERAFIARSQLGAMEFSLDFDSGRPTQTRSAPGRANADRGRWHPHNADRVSTLPSTDAAREAIPRSHTAPKPVYAAAINSLLPSRPGAKSSTTWG